MDPDALFDFSAPETEQSVGQQPPPASSNSKLGKRAASGEPDDSLPSKSVRQGDDASDEEPSHAGSESDEGDEDEDENENEKEDEDEDGNEGGKEDTGIKKEEKGDDPSAVSIPHPTQPKNELPTHSPVQKVAKEEDSQPNDAQGMQADAPENAAIAVTDDFTAESTQHIAAASAASGATAGAAPPTADDRADSSESTALTTGEGKAAGQVQLRHSVRHQVAVPAGVAYTPLAAHVPPKDPAKVYPFTLDPFQQTSVYCIQRHESVLVSAHTSAGKTVVAEYAIAHCLKGKQRVVYTSPIKALSNQKYRELSAEFGDVGLMTGDVTINPSASCLVMTTEILRSMLYRGSEIMREVAWVIFDEIHYMRDKDRGVVWEETIILLPRQVRYVFLSATIPNAMQFAEWIAQTHQQACHVVYTNFRPTPLQHYLYPQSADGIYLVVDEKGTFRDENFQKAMGALKDSHGEDPAAASSGSGKRKGQTKKGKGPGQQEDGQSDIYKIVKMIMVKNYNPVIVFAFSKRECEALAMQMSKLEFNTDEERDTVTTVFNNAISVLHPEDQELPQIKHILPLLQRGIGIHHGGLLPILKEVIEILFQEGLLKVLFATETFSIGLNMPAKTVVFTSVRKWDGTTFRNLSSGEFIQMSGRAGRRGLDDRGIVIMMFDEQLEPDDAKQMIRGQADRLDSAFHLGYNMVLNLMRVEGISPEFMLERCFYQFQQAASIPGLERERQAAEVTASAMVVPHETILEGEAAVRKQIALLENDYFAVTTHPSYALPFIQSGRLVRVQSGEEDFGWGAVVEFAKRQAPRGKEAAAEFERVQQDPQHAAEGYVVDVLLAVASSEPGVEAVRYGKARSILGVPPPPGPPRPNAAPPMHPARKDGQGGGEMVVVPVLLSCLRDLSGVRVFMPKDLRSREHREQMRKNLAEVQRRVKGRPPLLDPVKDMKIKDDAFKTLLQKLELLRKRDQELVDQLEKAVAKDLLPISTSKTTSKKEKKHASDKGGKGDKDDKSDKSLIRQKVASLESEHALKTNAFARAEALATKLAAARNVLQLDELKSRKRVLRRLGFVSEADVVMQKGRVACEISTGDELLLTELIFSGVFNTLDAASCAALASTFVFQEKSDTPAQIPEALVQPLQALQDTARRIARVARESRLDIKEDDYVRSFRVELIQPVLLWCSGKNFAEMLKLTDVFEGTIIRTFRRLQELLRQLVDAAKAIGNEELEQRFKAALELLERPNSIIFSPSLYL